MDDASRPLVDWRELAESIPGGVGIQRGSEFVYVSEALAETVGVEADVLVGEPWQALFDSAEAARLEEEAVERARADGRWEGEARSGGDFADATSLELALSATDHGAVVWIVSERDRELERYETIVETVDDGIYALDEDLRFSFVNDGVCEMLGRSAEELLGLPGRELFVDDDEFDVASEIRRRVVEGDTSTATIQGTLSTPDGDRIIESRYRLYPEPDGQFRGSVGVARDVTERERREAELERQRDELATLDGINELLLETVRELVQTVSRDAVERVVCERLAASDRYRSVWIGERELDGDRIVPRTTAGDANALEARATDGESETGRGPAERAMATGAVQVATVGDPAFDPWRDAASEGGVESVAAAPLQDDGAVYGVLVVCATSEDAFTEREQAGFDVLGRTVGSVVHAARSRELLFADAVVELEFRLGDDDPVFARTAGELDCELALEGYVASGERWILYLGVDGAPPDAVIEAVSGDRRVERARVLDREGATGQVELVVTGSALLHAATTAGASVRAATADPDRTRLTVEAPADAEVAAVVDHVRDELPGAEFLARRERDREPTAVGRPGGLLDELTDRQRDVLEAAYRSGYFAWPRESTAEEVAESLDLAAPTLHGHLRKAEGLILTALHDQ